MSQHPDAGGPIESQPPPQAAGSIDRQAAMPAAPSGAPDGSLTTIGPPVTQAPPGAAPAAYQLQPADTGYQQPPPGAGYQPQPPGAPLYPAYPVMAQPAVPRGPRPIFVTLAISLTFVGIGLAFLGVLLNFVANMDVTVPGDEGAANVGNAVGAFMSAGFNLLAGSGAAVAAVFAMRGSNGARITLCVLTGAFAGWKLACGGIGMLGLSLTSSNPDATPPGYRVGFGYAASALDLVLMVLAIGILVLLLVSPSHRYFTPPKPPQFM